MTKISKIDREEDRYLSEEGLAELWIEIDEKGLIKREIGFAADGTVRHKHPGDGPHGRYGLFDLVQFEPSTPADLPEEEFALMCEQPRVLSEAEGEPTGLFGKLGDYLSRVRLSRSA